MHPRRYKDQQKESVFVLLITSPGLNKARIPKTRAIPARHKMICSNISMQRARFLVTPRIRRNAASCAYCIITSPGPNSPTSTAAATAIGNSDSNRLWMRLVVLNKSESMWKDASGEYLMPLPFWSSSRLSSSIIFSLSVRANSQ